LRRYSAYANWMRVNYAQSTRHGIIVSGRLGRVIEAAWEAKSTSTRRSFPQWDDEDSEIDDDFFYSNGSGWAQDALKYTLCCNGPIQGICADASMLALIKVDAALREARIEGGPVLFVHDEIAIETRQEDAEAACRILTDAMVSAFAETFPNAPLNGVVSVRIGDSWGAPS